MAMQVKLMGVAISVSMELAGASVIIGALAGSMTTEDRMLNYKSIDVRSLSI